MLGPGTGAGASLYAVSFCELYQFKCTCASSVTSIGVYSGVEQWPEWDAGLTIWPWFQSIHRQRKGRHHFA